MGKNKNAYTYNVGDQVQWVKVTRRGTSIDVTTLYGTIQSIQDDQAIILPDDSTRRVKIALSRLRPIGSPSPVNDLVRSMLKRGR